MLLKTPPSVSVPPFDAEIVPTFEIVPCRHTVIVPPATSAAIVPLSSVIFPVALELFTVPFLPWSVIPVSSVRMPALPIAFESFHRWLFGFPPNRKVPVPSSLPDPLASPKYICPYVVRRPCRC